MQEDFHYYATYCAASLAGFTAEESRNIAYSANFVDLCSRSLLSGIGAPLSAATTQLTFEMADARTDIVGLQDITRIWASFHFLPYDLYADVKKGSGRYKYKYRLICGPNGRLVADTVALARGKSLQAMGLAMHVIADTWAHQNFAGTPSFVINNVGGSLYEWNPSGSWDPVKFSMKPGADDLEGRNYSGTIYQPDEDSIFNLGHGRAGHFPDYSFMKYKYMPAWADYKEVVRDNPSDYYNAFCQMIYALKTLRDPEAVFETGRYDTEAAAPHEQEIKRFMNIRQLMASDGWKALGERISGEEIPDFDAKRYLGEYTEADREEKDDTFLGRFILAALAQKSMVTGKIFQSGSRLAGFSVDIKKGFRGIRDFRALLSRKPERTDSSGGAANE